MEEIWKWVLGFKGLYKISNKGRVLRYYKTAKPRLIKISKGTYLFFKACDKNTRLHCNIHRILALTFIDNPENFPCVNHIDGNKHNNSLDNLEWCTHKQNTVHAYNEKLISIPIGEKRFNSKLKRNQVLEIKKLIKNGVRVVDIAKTYGVARTTISCIKHGRNWKHI